MKISLIFFLNLFIIITTSCSRYAISDGQKFYIVKIENITQDTPKCHLSENMVFIKKIKRYKNDLYVIYAEKDKKSCVILSKYNEHNNEKYQDKLKNNSVYTLEMESIWERSGMTMFVEIRAFPYENYYDIWLPDCMSIADVYVSKQLNGIYLINK